MTTINPLNHNYKLTAEQQKEKLMKACTDFESFFYKLIMKTGRNSGFKSDLIKKSNAEEIFTDMFDDEVSKLASTKSKGGIKDMLFDSLKDSLGASINKKGNNFREKINKIYQIEKSDKIFVKDYGIDIAQ